VDDNQETKEIQRQLVHQLGNESRNHRNLRIVILNVLIISLSLLFQAGIYIGVCIMLASTVGGLRNIITDSSTYSFYT